MTLLAWAVLIGLASYRLFRVVALDIIAEPVRDWLYAESGSGRQFLADLFSCPWCAGWWWAGGGALAVALSQDYGVVEFLLLWFAGSTIAGATHKAIDA